MRKKNGILIKNNGPWERYFSSMQELARHLCLGADKTRRLLKGRSVLTEEELKEMEQVCYLPKNYDHLKKSAKALRKRR